MAIDSVNWRRELEGVRAEVRALKDEMSQIQNELSTMNELLRLIAANQIMTNVEELSSDKEKILRSVTNTIKSLQWKKQRVE